MCVLMQGLADTFIILGMAFDSPEAKQLNKDIFECIYFHALTTSSALAKVDGEHTVLSTCCIWSLEHKTLDTGVNSLRLDNSALHSTLTLDMRQLLSLCHACSPVV